MGFGRVVSPPRSASEDASSIIYEIRANINYNLYLCRIVGLTGDPGIGMAKNPGLQHRAEDDWAAKFLPPERR